MYSSNGIIVALYLLNTGLVRSFAKTSKFLSNQSIEISFTKGKESLNIKNRLKQLQRFLLGSKRQ